MNYAKILAAAILAAVLGSATSAHAELVAKNLLTGLPDGFEVAMQDRQGQLSMMEFIPKGESTENWSAMVTVQVMHGIKDGDGEAFARNLAKLWQGGCEGSSARQLQHGEVNRYAFVLWHYVCPLNVQSGKPETMWLKAISGADALYVVQYAYRAAPSSQLEQPALTYLDKVSACDTRREDRQCPAGM